MITTLFSFKAFCLIGLVLASQAFVVQVILTIEEWNKVPDWRKMQ